MIIKSHVRGGFNAIGSYLLSPGSNEKVRCVEINDPSARNIKEAFDAMWALTHHSKVQKPIHHVSINPHRHERLTDEQVQSICARLEEKYGYKPGEHQRVIVEHVKDGRQHFHVVWNRVSLRNGRAVWPGEHWKKSKQAAREMEVELGLKRSVQRNVRAGQMRAAAVQTGQAVCGANALTRRRRLMVRFAEAKRGVTGGNVGAGHSMRVVRATITRPKLEEVAPVRSRKPRCGVAPTVPDTDSRLV